MKHEELLAKLQSVNVEDWNDISSFLSKLSKASPPVKNYTKEEYLITFEVTDQVLADFEKYLNTKRKTNIVVVAYKEHKERIDLILIQLESNCPLS